MRKIIIISMLALAGCSARPILQNESGITYERVTLGNQGKTAAAAQQHCALYGKNAILAVDRGGIMSFRCE